MWFRNSSSDLEVSSWESGIVGIVLGRLVGATWVDLSELLILLAGGHLLGEQCRLNTVKQTFEPPDQLGLGDTKFSIAGNAIGKFPPPKNWGNIVLMVALGLGHWTIVMESEESKVEQVIGK